MSTESAIGEPRDYCACLGLTPMSPLGSYLTYPLAGLPATTSVQPEGACSHCSGPWSWVVHSGRCPEIKAIEYHPSGSVKRIEYR